MSRFRSTPVGFTRVYRIDSAQRVDQVTSLTIIC